MVNPIFMSALYIAGHLICVIYGILSIIIALKG